MMIDKDMHSHHISQQFNTELDAVKTHLLEMGGLVEKQVADAIHSLVEADSNQAEKVKEGDKRINQMEVSIDEARKIAIQAIALAQEGESSRGYVEIRHIGQHVGCMVRDALDAFARLDADMALNCL